MKDVTRELASLAKGPNRAAKRFSGYIVNGYRFHTKRRDQKCTTQNSGVYLTALTTSFASSKDQNPKTGDVNYYGSIEEIIELDYWGAFTVVLFRCTWYVDDKDSLGFTRVNFNRVRQKDDPFVMSTQVQQVFYIQDPTELQFYYPIKKFSSESFEQDDKNLAEDVKGKKEVKGVNEYEKRRNKNIEENEKKFQELGLRRHSAGTPVQKKPNNRKAFSDDKESDNYDPKNDSDQSSDNEEDMAISKVQCT